MKFWKGTISLWYKTCSLWCIYYVYFPSRQKVAFYTGALFFIFIFGEVGNWWASKGHRNTHLRAHQWEPGVTHTFRWGSHYSISCRVVFPKTHLIADLSWMRWQQKVSIRLLLEIWTSIQQRKISSSLLLEVLSFI